MNWYSIRLNAAWQLQQSADASAADTGRVHLPQMVEAGLVRGFHRPANVQAETPVRLRLLILGDPPKVELNDTEIIPAESGLLTVNGKDGVTELLFPLQTLASFNRLRVTAADGGGCELVEAMLQMSEG